MSAKVNLRIVTLPITVSGLEIEEVRGEPPRLYEQLLELWRELLDSQGDRDAFKEGS
jgi:hypothetical protein